jgi:hypothetical protein
VAFGLLWWAYDDLPGRQVYRAASGIAVADVLASQFQAVLLVAGVLAAGREEFLENVEHGSSLNRDTPESFTA